MREMFSGLTIDHETFVSLHMASKTVYRLYVDVLRSGQESGKFVDGDPAALTGVLWSVLHGLVMLIIENQMRPYADGPESMPTENYRAEDLTNVSQITATYGRSSVYSLNILHCPSEQTEKHVGQWSRFSQTHHWR
jgi:hypothetical protein